jgi:cell division protein FtsB
MMDKNTIKRNDYMKKFVLGLALGLAIAIPIGAHAEVVSLVNQVVQGLFPVTVDNKPLGDAIVVDNKTYLPVREFAEAAGYKVTFTDDKQVVLTKNEVSSVPTTTTDSPNVTRYRQVAKELLVLGNEKIALENKLNEIKTTHATMDQNVDDLNQQITDKQAQIDKLVIEKNALEAQIKSQP